MAKVLTDANFAETLNTDIPVVVDFWATWCRPCQMMGPIVDELADEYAGQVIVAKMDVDQCNSICARYGITNIPNFKLFKNGVAYQIFVDRFYNGNENGEFLGI